MVARRSGVRPVPCAVRRSNLAAAAVVAETCWGALFNTATRSFPLQSRRDLAMPLFTYSVRGGDRDDTTTAAGPERRIHNTHIILLLLILDNSPSQSYLYLIHLLYCVSCLPTAAAAVVVFSRKIRRNCIIVLQCSIVLLLARFIVDALR